MLDLRLVQVLAQDFQLALEQDFQLALAQDFQPLSASLLG